MRAESSKDYNQVFLFIAVKWDLPYRTEATLYFVGLPPLWYSTDASILRYPQGQLVLTGLIAAPNKIKVLLIQMKM